MRGRPARQQVSQSASVPAPVGGWNARDSIAAMEPTDAVTLDNWFPEANSVTVRRGYEAYASCTGITEDVQTLAVWNGPTASQMFAITYDTAPEAFNISVAGAAAADAGFAALLHTGTTAKYSQVMFNNVAGYYLYLCDETGTNPPCHYSGAAWAAPAITGVTATKLVHVSLFKFRLFFCEKDSLNIWYLPLDAIAGAAAKITLGGFCNEGGSVVATANWTVDSGEGVDDKFVAITDKGQVAIFGGDDPSSASSWALEGVYKTAPPIGRRCFLRQGSDLYIITTDGLIALSSIFSNNAVDQVPALSDKIRLAFQQAAREFSTTFGWQAVYYPRGKYIFVNVPQYQDTTGELVPKSDQYVMNTQTRSWCRFKDQNAKCWAIFNGELYFGEKGGTVRKADATTSDNGGGIRASCRQAYNYFGLRGQNKRWVLARPTIETDASLLNLSVGIDVDFQGRQVNASTALNASPSLWDVAEWDIATWDGNTVFSNEWSTYGGIGYCAALVFNIIAYQAYVAWYATDWVYEGGGVL